MVSATLLALALPARVAPLTLNIEPKPLRRAVPELAAATGMRLAVSEVLADEVLQVQVTDVEPEALLRRVADVVGGTWTTDASGTRRLVEDVGLTSELKRKALQTRTSMIAEEIAKLVKELEGKPEPDSEPPEVARSPEGDMQFRVEGGGSPSVRMPGGRAVVRALRSLNAAELAALGEGKRVVYTSNPTAMQRRLPGLPLRDAATFLAEQRAAAASRTVRRGREGGSPPPPAPEPRSSAEPSKVFLILHRAGEGIQATLVVTDQQGATLATGFLWLMTESGRLQRNLAPASEGASAAEPVAASPFSDGAVAAAKALSARASGGAVVVATLDAASEAVVVVEGEPGGEGGAAEGRPVVEQLFDPAEHEPLGLFAGEAMSHLASDADLVACIPDSALAPLATYVATGRGEAEGKGLPYVVDRADGWAVVRPRDILRSRAERADRTALDLLAGSVRADGVLRLSPLARYAATAPELPGGLDLALVRALDPTAPGRFGDVYGDGRAALRSFARLQGPDFAALESGMTRSVASLGGPTLGVAEMVYHSQRGPALEQQEAGRDPRARPGRPEGYFELPMPAGGEFGRLRFGLGDMRVERTEILPTGVPGGTAIAMETRRTEALYAFDPKTGAARFTSAGRLGAEAGMSELLPERMRRAPGSELYAPATQTEYTMTFLLAPGVTMAHRLTDPTRADLRQAMAVADFTGKLAEEYREAYAQAKSRSARIGERRRNVTPPPAP